MNDELAIRQLVATWISASKAGDTQKVLSLMADDVVFLVPGQPPMRKRDFAAGQAALAQLEFEAKSDIQEIEITGDRAYVWTRLAVTMTPKGGGASVKRAGHTLSILRKQNGAWVIYRDANLLAPVS
jgi:uncharacterized protein (TIGR02246 family)